MINRLESKKSLKESRLVKAYLLLFLIDSFILLYAFIFAEDKEFFADFLIVGLFGLFFFGLEIFNFVMLVISIKRKYPIQFSLLPLSEIFIVLVFPIISDVIIKYFAIEATGVFYYTTASILKILQIIWTIYIIFYYFRSKSKKEKQK